ncbi:MAG: hypothetical protein ACK5JF_09060 [Oscillospiraceae bacterium]
MNIPLLYDRVSTFRDSIIKSINKNTPFVFLDFPMGCCSDASLLLGMFFSGFEAYDIEYVSARCEQLTHVWLTVNGKIVDITCGQFEYFDGSIYIGEKNSFYECFDAEIPDREPIVIEQLEEKLIKYELYSFYKTIMNNL